MHVARMKENAVCAEIMCRLNFAMYDSHLNISEVLIPHMLVSPTLYYLPGELIMSIYVAESITIDAGRFGHVGLCQLRTCTQLTKAYVAETSCIDCY